MKVFAVIRLTEHPFIVIDFIVNRIRFQHEYFHCECVRPEIAHRERLHNEYIRDEMIHIVPVGCEEHRCEIVPNDYFPSERMIFRNATSSSRRLTSQLARSSRVQVLQQVIADLHVAQSLLNTNYVDGSDTLTSSDRVRPNKAAATALLARAYLYFGDYSSGNLQDYQKADSAASAVIGNTNYNYSLSPLNGVFLKNSTEAIWQIGTVSNQGSDTPEGNYFILVSDPQNGLTNNSTISPQLLSSFELGDQRKTDWIGSYFDGTTTYYFPYKYKQNTNAGLEYEMVLRLGEQFLIRAEARAHEGNIPGAQSDLNMIRNRAGLPNTTANSTATLLPAILHERQVELFTEWGARWFDLCRTGNAPSVMGSPGNVTQFKGGTWNPDNHQLLFPIPQSDRVDDPKLSQNPGY